MIVKQIKDKNLKRDFLEHKVAVHCETFEEATVLVDFLNENIREDRPMASSEYRSYGNKTTIVFSTENGWGYENVEYSEEVNGLYVAEFRDFVVMNNDSDIEFENVFSLRGIVRN